ncbi:IPT/TIG domain protein [Planctomycetes bacterium Poly30]|uniref:IPT/TIG domain protein n=1 Tax=Saltatorellus ferox TaxID=2528018 RepID=A0A518EXW7_9BACT|nr:IPT/TIG domain protein [Planctomycetes bacterium Poly30]
MWTSPSGPAPSLLASSARAAVGFTLAAGLAASVTGHVRLRYSVNGTELRWTSPENISLVINSDGSDDVADGSHETAIRSAVEAWNAVNGSRARMVIDDSTAARERRDWQSNDIHLVVFDETGSSGYFAGASGIVAITPVTFFTDGRIIDADVVFNGKNFYFTTSGETAKFDIQDVASHELGHLLGLDHSGVCGATMYPYVDPKVILHRSLAIDDQNGMRDIYPESSFARINGRVTRGDGSGIAGAHVVALDPSGRLAGASLASASGNYSLEGLQPGTFSLYADPLDQPVSSANLGGGQAVQTDFGTTSLGTVTVGGGQTRDLGTRTALADVAVALGRISDDYPIRIVQGRTVNRTIRGSGLVAGSTLECSDPTIGLSNVVFRDTALDFSVTVPAGSPTGHVDLTVTDPSGARDTLVGGLEITPPDPIVLSADPTIGDPNGGVDVVIVGEHFRDGSRVVIGDRIYRDGASGGCTVVDSQTITLRTAPTIAGSHDVVVIDPSGVEGRSQDSFVVSAVPDVTAVFPQVGSASGGTEITISGQDLVPDLQVEIDGMLQPQVFVESPTRMRVVTTGGVPGGPYVLRVLAPGGLSSESAFTYVPNADPEISVLSPDEADMGGGAPIIVYGSGFNENTRVIFGADTRTGLGGQLGETTMLTSGSLRVIAPQSGVGTKSVVVKNIDTGQAVTMTAGFTFTGEEPVDDGSGGCAAVLPPMSLGGPRPPTWQAALGGSGWILLALLLAWIRAASVTRQLAPTPRVGSR